MAEYYAFHVIKCNSSSKCKVVVVNAEATPDDYRTRNSGEANNSHDPTLPHQLGHLLLF